MASCSNCGQSLQDGARFCSSCSASLTSSSDAPDGGTVPAAPPFVRPNIPNKRTTFSEIFSITWKVLLALFLISIGVGFVYLIIIHGGVSSIRSGSKSDEGFKHEYINAKEYYDKKADEKHTTLPQSKWNQLIASAIKQHCPVEGMTQADAESALGKPSAFAPTKGISGNGETWQYEQTTQEKCLKYNGEDCAEYQLKHETVTLYFSPSGHLTYPLEGGWLRTNCYDEPFYSTYYKLLD